MCSVQSRVLFIGTETGGQHFLLVYKLNVHFLFDDGKKILCAVMVFHCFLQFVPVYSVPRGVLDTLSKPALSPHRFRRFIQLV